MMPYNARMHHIQSEIHNGAHVDVFYRYSDDGADIASIPVESYVHQPVLYDFADSG